MRSDRLYLQDILDAIEEVQRRFPAERSRFGSLFRPSNFRDHAYRSSSARPK
jgi:hypothetical protein